MATRAAFLWIIIVFSYSSCMTASPNSNIKIPDYNDRSRMDIKRAAVTVKPDVGGSGAAGSVIGSGSGSGSTGTGGSSSRSGGSIGLTGASGGSGGGGGRSGSSGGSSSSGTGKGSSSSSSSGKGGSAGRVGAGSSAAATTVAARNSYLRTNDPLTGAFGATAMIIVVAFVVLA